MITIQSSGTQRLFDHSFIHQYSALRLVRQELELSQATGIALAGTLHPGQVLRIRLPLLSPAFRLSHFRRQVPPCPQRRERSQQRKVELWARNVVRKFCRNDDFHAIQGSFTCRKSTTWNRRLYFPSEGRRAEDFFALKNPTASAGFEPANLGTRGQHATPGPPKPTF